MNNYFKYFVITIFLFFGIAFLSLQYLNNKESVKNVEEVVDVSTHNQFCADVPRAEITLLKIEGSVVEDQKTFEYNYDFENSELPALSELKMHLQELIRETCNSYSFPMTEDFMFKPTVWQPPTKPDVEATPFMFYKNKNNAVLRLVYTPAKRESFQTKADCLQQPAFAAMDQIAFEAEETFSAQSSAKDRVSLVCAGQFEAIDHWELSQ